MTARASAIVGAFSRIITKRQKSVIFLQDLTFLSDRFNIFVELTEVKMSDRM